MSFERESVFSERVTSEGECILKQNDFGEKMTLETVYGVASISRLLKIIGLFSKSAL